MEWSIILLLAVAALLVLFPVVFVWYICIGGICMTARLKRTASRACSIDADCPPGYHCVGGYCVPTRA